MKTILTIIFLASTLVLAGCGGLWNQGYSLLLEPNMERGDSPTQCQIGNSREKAECFIVNKLDKVTQ